MVPDYREIKNPSYIEISDEEFELITKFVYKHIGIHLTDGKKALVTGRLQKILRKYQLKSFKDYFDLLKNDSTGKELSLLADTISTNHTYFWREFDHFEFFEKVALPEIISQKKSQNSKELRIWCAGSSTGEEPYTLVMLMKEVLGYDYENWDAGILATDISDRALSIARAGIYNEQRLENLPDKLRSKYFKKHGGSEYIITDSVRKEVTYKRFNLMNETFPFKKPFDIIFCRNVMIYFDADTRAVLSNKFFNFQYPGGFLFIGHSETLDRNRVPYQFIKPAVYKRMR